MRELERENSRLKRIVGELALDNAAQKELAEKKGASGFRVGRVARSGRHEVQYPYE